MEEKPHFHYDAHIQYGKPPGRHFARILNMSNLQPMAIRWEDTEGEVWVKVFHLDFVNEVVYDYANKTGDYYPAIGPIADEVLKILRDKKAEIQKPMLPEGYVESVLGRKQQIFEKRPDAGKHQS